MNAQEIRDKIMAAINNLIKDEPDSSEAAEANLHDVLAAKMRARMNGSAPDQVDPAIDLDNDPDHDTTAESVTADQDNPGA